MTTLTMEYIQSLVDAINAEAPVGHRQRRFVAKETVSDSGHHYYKLILDDGTCPVSVWITNGRLRVSPDYLRQGNTCFEPVADRKVRSITLSQERLPLSLARDLWRRVLGAYLDTWPETVALRDDYLARGNAKDALILSIAQLVGKSPESLRDYRGELRSDFNVQFGHGEWVDIYVSGPDSVTLKFHSLPARLGLAILMEAINAAQ